MKVVLYSKKYIYSIIDREINRASEYFSKLFYLQFENNEENFVFDRAMDGNSKTLEFFVPANAESKFLSIMQYFKSTGYILSFEKLENRFKYGNKIKNT